MSTLSTNQNFLTPYYVFNDFAGLGPYVRTYGHTAEEVTLDIKLYYSNNENNSNGVIAITGQISSQSEISNQSISPCGIAKHR